MTNVTSDRELILQQATLINNLCEKAVKMTAAIKSNAETIDLLESRIAKLEELIPKYDN